MHNSLVSILLPVFNSERFLRFTLDSVIGQTYPDIEIIVVDDGSTDETPKILAEYAEQDCRFRIIKKPNSGIADTLNEGLRHAKGDLVARIDADDLMLPHRISVQREYLLSEPKLGFCSSAVDLIDLAGYKFGRSQLPPSTIEELDGMIQRRVPISFTHPAVMFRREAVVAAGGYDRHFEPVEDLELFSRLILGGMPGLVIPEVLTSYRVHGNSISGSRIGKQMAMRNFVTHNFYRRYAGLPGFTQQQYAANVSSESYVARLKRHARIKCDTNKQMALYHRAEGKRVRELLRYAAASLWQPSSAARYAARVVRKATGALLPKSLKTSEASSQGVTTRY